jgi:threonine/homoserine/homoserine lactone efflux protein
MLASAVIGFGLGFAVAATVGPISLLLIRTTLRGAPASGLAIGAGAAVIDTA